MQLALAVGGPAFAQEDTTAPVLLEFSASPVVFDTAPGAVEVTMCARVADDLSGVANVVIVANCENAGAGCGGSTAVIYPPNNEPSGAFFACSSMTLPRFSRYDSLVLLVYVNDATHNQRLYVPGTAVPHTEDLCEFGPCGLRNRASASSPDADNDGTPDDGDNCTDVANADQADSDVDLIGDACDAFPDDRDNEQAQCEVDLGQSTRVGRRTARQLERALSELSRERADADEDGVRDLDDDCPATAASSEVDRQGCSLAQFCHKIVAASPRGRKACRKADWNNDQPLMKTPEESDCAIVPSALKDDASPAGCEARVAE